MEKYLHAEQSLPPLVAIGCLHYQFEAVHPFIDGNGRVGRLLVTLLLAEWNLLAPAPAGPVLMEEPGAVELLGRVPSQIGTTVVGYHLRVSSDDGFELYSEDPTQGRVALASGDADVVEGAWHTMALRM